MEFSRGKVQVLYNYLPGAIFPHDDYGFCRVTGIDVQRDEAINQQAVAESVADTLQQWRDQWRRDGFPEIRDAANFARHYAIGVPMRVHFAPYPGIFQCQRCRRVYRLRDLKPSGNREPRRCVAQGCGGSLTQFPFVQAHNCGRLDEPYTNKIPCRRHGYGAIYFDDTGRVATARWRCRACGGAEIARLRQTPCRCGHSEHATSPGAQYMRVYSVTDPAVFRPWVVPFVNFNPGEIIDTNMPEARTAIVGRMWGIIDTPVKAYLTEMKAATDGEGPEVEALVRELEAVVPDHPKVRDWRAKQHASQVGQKKIEQVAQITGTTDPSALAISRRMTEHIAILDTLNSSTVSAVEKRFRRSGDIQAAERIRAGGEYATQHLGFKMVRSLQDFPVGLCALGYTRVSKSPEDSVLNPFPQIDGRTPLYTVTTTTEALYFQLDPMRVVEWLAHNRIITGAVPEDDVHAWGWIYRHCSGLRQVPQQPEYNEPTSVAVRTLLHSISHVLLRNIEWSGYAAQSLGEYLLPDGLACVLYANRYTDTKVGGLLTLFEQELHGWLEASRQSGADCVFDPFCTEVGGACVGCLHREYNCPSFNRELSRAVLYGGPICREGQAALPFGDISFGYWC